MKKLDGETVESNYSFFDAKVFDMGERNRKNEMKVFDWDAAAQKIKDVQPKVAKAGLQGDFEYTGGTIYEDGEINESDYTYLASTWATPILVLDDVVYECFVMEKQTTFKHSTKWPKSALKILKGE